MSEHNKITFAIKYLSMSHWVMMSSITTLTVEIFVESIFN